MLKLVLVFSFALINLGHAEDLEDGLVQPSSEVKNDQFLEGLLNQKVELDEVHQAVLKSPEKTTLKVSYDKKTIVVALEPGTTTPIVLPENEAISHFTLGDSSRFEGQPVPDKEKNKFLVKVKYTGAATTLHLFGKSGAIYAFYLYGIKPNSKELPSYLVYINDELNFSNTDNSLNVDEEPGLSNERYDFLESSNHTGVKNVKYSIYGDEEIAPYAVYDNGEFTYFDFRKNLRSGRYPNLYKISDEYDDQIMTEKRDGYLIAKAISREGWTLINGDKIVCIKPQ